MGQATVPGTEDTGPHTPPPNSDEALTPRMPVLGDGVANEVNYG